MSSAVQAAPTALLAQARWVAAYRYPRKAWITGELPKGSTGKFVKREIVLPDDLGL